MEWNKQASWSCHLVGCLAPASWPAMFAPPRQRLSGVSMCPQRTSQLPFVVAYGFRLGYCCWAGVSAIVLVGSLLVEVEGKTLELFLLCGSSGCQSRETDSDKELQCRSKLEEVMSRVVCNGARQRHENREELACAGIVGAGFKISLWSHASSVRSCVTASPPAFKSTQQPDSRR